MIAYPGGRFGLVAGVDSLVSEDRLEQLRRILVAVFAALLIALLVWLTLSSHQAEQSRRAAQAQEIRTLTTLRATDRVLRTMQNAETGQRGYLLTGDRAFLQPLRAAQADLPDALGVLRELALDDGTASGRVKRIEELCSSQMRQLERGLALFEKGQLARSGVTAGLQTGKQTMDTLRVELAGLESQMQMALTQSQALARHHEDLAAHWRTLLTAFTVVLGMLFAAAAVGMLRARSDAREQKIRARSDMILEAGRHLLQSIIDSSQNAIFVKTRRGEILFANTEFRRIVGQPLEDLYGVPVPPTEDPECAARLAKADHDALERGERSEVDLLLEVEGKTVWYRAEKNPWVRDGKIIGVIGITRNISEDKNRETELEQRVAERTAELEDALESVRREMTEREAAQESLRQLQKIESLGQLTGGIAHDFNNMIAVVVSSLDTVRRQLPGIAPDALATLIETALAGANSAADLTARLLAFARQQQLRPSPVEINELAVRTRLLLDRTFDKRIQISLDLDPAAGWVEVDDSQLENALINLAVNARDAMPNGGRLSISTRRRGPEVEILVSDTGEGMTPDQLSRVFDPFFTTKQIGMGTGLGLSQVHGFVNQSGGRIAIQSSVNQGTIVCIDLPACEPPAEEAVSRVETKVCSGHGELVLLVEDEALVRLSTQASLQALGYRVVSASNGYDALTLLEDDPEIAVMITDVSMPTMDGRDLAKAAQLLRPDLAVLLTTGLEQGRQGGDDLPVLAKPYLLDELAAMISALLGRSQREQAGGVGNSPNHGAAGKEELSGSA